MTIKVDNILSHREGEPISKEAFKQGQMQLNEVTILMALEYVKTRRAAENIYYAECNGLKRPSVIARAIRRMDDFNDRTIPTGNLEEAN